MQKGQPKRFGEKWTSQLSLPFFVGGGGGGGGEGKAQKMEEEHKGIFFGVCVCVCVCVLRSRLGFQKNIRERNFFSPFLERRHFLSHQRLCCFCLCLFPFPRKKVFFSSPFQKKGSFIQQHDTRRPSFLPAPKIFFRNS